MFRQIRKVYTKLSHPNKQEQKILNLLFLIVLAWGMSDLGGQETRYLESFRGGTETLAYQIAVNIMVTGWILGVYALLMIHRLCKQDLINRNKQE